MASSARPVVGATVLSSVCATMFRGPIDLFKECIQLSDDDYRKRGMLDPNVFALDAVIFQKLSQVAWIYELCEAYHSRFLRESASVSDINPAMFQLSLELETLTEAFYLFAFALREALDRHPRYGRFDAPGIRNVRNRLIIHPEGEKERAKIYPSFGIGSEGGPAIKDYIGPTGSFEDPGLFVNAVQLRDRLRRKFESVIAELRPAPGQDQS